MKTILILALLGAPADYYADSGSLPPSVYFDEPSGPPAITLPSSPTPGVPVIMAPPGTKPPGPVPPAAVPLRTASPSVPTGRSGEAGQAPTPIAEVRRVLAILRPQANEKFIDYGAGDGRWLIEASRTYGCRSVGIEIDPAQVAKARAAITAAGLSHLVELVEGDVLTTGVEGHVGVAYLYPDLLTQLKPKLMRLNRFASMHHAVEGVSMQQSGDAWIYQKPQPAQVAPVQTTAQPQAVWWQGQAYTGRVCNSPFCSMCNSISRMLGR